MSETVKHYREPSHNVYVESTLNEVELFLQKRIATETAAIEKAKNKLAAAKKACKHKLFHDQPTPTYTQRFCSVCGAFLENI